MENVFARHADGSVYLVDFGEFECGVVDLTDPKAYAWFRDRVIRRLSLDIGIGGYTSLFGNTRTKELFLRWAEMAVFTPVMRTHEGNRPDDCFQYYDDDDCMNRLARLTSVHTALRPLFRQLVRENASCGLPVQRPLFLHNESDPRCLSEQFEYLLGPDILVAPVWQEGQDTRTVYLPKGEWVHLWSGSVYAKGEHTVPAPLGEPPVFCRRGSTWEALMEDIRHNLKNS